MYVAERWKIEAYLSLVKKLRLEDLVIPGRKDPRSKTSLFMRRLGYTPDDVLGVLRNLEVADYSEGPKLDDKGRPRDLWVFGKIVESILVYIKFTMFYDEEAIAGVCVSFHGAERDMVFPYKGV